jgi:hypothetical protein
MRTTRRGRARPTTPGSDSLPLGAPGLGATASPFRPARQHKPADLHQPSGSADCWRHAVGGLLCSAEAAGAGFEPTAP